MVGKPGLPTVFSHHPAGRIASRLTRRTALFSSPEEVLSYIKDEDIKFVDIRFCDLPGVMQHFNVPAESID